MNTSASSASSRPGLRFQFPPLGPRPRRWSTSFCEVDRDVLAGGHRETRPRPAPRVPVSRIRVIRRVRAGGAGDQRGVGHHAVHRAEHRRAASQPPVTSPMLVGGRPVAAESSAAPAAVAAGGAAARAWARGQMVSSAAQCAEVVAAGPGPERRPTPAPTAGGGYPSPYPYPYSYPASPRHRSRLTYRRHHLGLGRLQVLRRHRGPAAARSQQFVVER